MMRLSLILSVKHLNSYRYFIEYMHVTVSLPESLDFYSNLTAKNRFLHDRKLTDPQPYDRHHQLRKHFLTLWAVSSAHVRIRFKGLPLANAKIGIVRYSTPESPLWLTRRTNKTLTPYLWMRQCQNWPAFFSDFGNTYIQSSGDT
jgi:hypothetical protein